MRQPSGLHIPAYFFSLRFIRFSNGMGAVADRWRMKDRKKVWES